MVHGFKKHRNCLSIICFLFICTKNLQTQTTALCNINVNKMNKKKFDMYIDTLINLRVTWQKSLQSTRTLQKF